MHGGRLFSPKRKGIDCEYDQLLPQWIVAVTRDVPTVHNAVWTVFSGGRLLAYLICDDVGEYTFELAVFDDKMSVLGIDEIYCCYYAERRFAGKYPECSDLIGKVKSI